MATSPDHTKAKRESLKVRTVVSLSCFGLNIYFQRLENSSCKFSFVSPVFRVVFPAGRVCRSQFCKFFHDY